MIGAMVGDICWLNSGSDMWHTEVISSVALSFHPAIMESDVAEFYKSLIQRQNGKG